jgi:hypothetical protein
MLTDTRKEQPMATQTEDNTKTRRIAGFEMTLLEGARYVASRPMANRVRKVYPVTVWDEDGNNVFQTPGLTYDQANEVLDKFNTGSFGFEGRRW